MTDAGPSPFFRPVNTPIYDMVANGSIERVMTDRGAIESIAETLDVEWRSGVGGAQCDDCGRFTIVRSAGRDYMGEPTGWLCRACALGLADDFDPQREGSADE